MLGVLEKSVELLLGLVSVQKCSSCSGVRQNTREVRFRIFLVLSFMHHELTNIGFRRIRHVPKLGRHAPQHVDVSIRKIRMLVFAPVERHYLNLDVPLIRGCENIFKRNFTQYQLFSHTCFVFG